MRDSKSNTPQKKAIAELKGKIRRWEQGISPTVQDVLSTGCAAIDDLLPDRGIRQGNLIEWIGKRTGCRAATLALIVGRQVCQAGRPFILIDPNQSVFPPALQALGFDLSHVVIVRPALERDALWACEEALRCEGVGLVWAEIARLTGTGFRRLQLAAEKAGTIGFLLRSAEAQQQPSWADARLLIYPRPSRNASPCFRVEVMHRQGGLIRSFTEVTLDSQGTVREVSDTNATDLMSVVS